MHKLLFLVLMLCIYMQPFSQCKSFDLLSNGDTINCIDVNGKKRGKWKVIMPALRGNPGYEEEGIYKNGLKEGRWRVYDLWGMLIAYENYKWGQKHGIQQYLVNGQLEHEESWKTLDPDKKFDTIDVIDPVNPNNVSQVIVKVEPYPLEHGIWKYYDPETGALLKKEEYLLGKLYEPTKESITTNKLSIEATDSILNAKKKVIPKEVQDYDKKNKNKKNIKVRDGRTGRVEVFFRKQESIVYNYHALRCV